MPSCSEGDEGLSALAERSGQSTVELALVLPSILLVLGLLVQPICLGYGHCVMASCASELARVLATRRQDMGDQQLRDYALRRLHAIPEVSILHVGGDDDWELSCEGAEGDGTVAVSLRGHCRPIPVLGILPTLLGEVDEAGLVMEVRVEERVRPSWLGGDYGSWTGIWS